VSKFKVSNGPLHLPDENRVINQNHISNENISRLKKWKKVGWFFERRAKMHVCIDNDRFVNDFFDDKIMTRSRTTRKPFLFEAKKNSLLYFFKVLFI